jgi:hypothetical protein
MSMFLRWKSALRSLSVAVFAAGVGIACSATPGSSQTVTAVLPSYEEFVGADRFGPGVHVFLENQCGGLDCHGQVGRPLRIYSTNGLRLPNDASLMPGSGLVSSDELFANFSAAINIEPAEMTRVVEGLDAPTQLLLVKKPLGLERHKGGTRMVMGDDMYTCLTSWLLDSSTPGGAFDSAACGRAALLQ